jgi:ElaB/YqjD/DUF883 family membrane-anchored ribosome-binding protein
MNRINNDFRVDSQKSPHQLEREIDATRAELLSTIEELEHRLSPSDLINQLWGQVRQHGGDFGGNLGQKLRDNPMPVLLTTIGIAWMMASNGRQHDSVYMSGSRLYDGEGSANGNGRSRVREAGERVRETGERIRERMHGVRHRMHDVRDKVQGARDSMRHRADEAREGVVSARERASGSTQHMRERARSMSSSARYRASQAHSGFSHLLEEQPLLLGAIGLAAGVIAGAALPPTEQEDRAFGKTRDRALERAKQASAEKARLVRERAEEAAESTKSALKSSGDADTGSTPTDHLTTQAGGSVEKSPGTHTSSPGTGLGY